MTQASETCAITATIVPDERRMDILPRYFGSHMIRAEVAVYTAMSSLCATYHGGFWDYVELSNGAFYMAPRLSDPLPITCDGNGYGGEMSSDAAGIVATLFALNAMAWSTEDAAFTDLYHRVLAFVPCHAEAREIFAAID
ncbi:antirestriction protein [Burkholderia cenocepacia]|uniref:antirestriction protein n=1 Tax=Burkholderia cenocepacia TaxID=95486 RepID=UPI001BA31508|nr:antirestriction protein [Burkholderia cenocepacia]MBR8024569.1 antirestriction protein [Burkholderia cenocepacia]MBR8171592.1 antirestriction protein [Burkholderia cenocepacia]